MHSSRSSDDFDAADAAAPGLGGSRWERSRVIGAARGGGAPRAARDAARSRFPFSLVWTPLPGITALLLWRVSGTPLLERSSWRKYGGDPAWLDYRARTSLFFPWWPAAVAAPADLARARERAREAAAAKAD